MFKITHQKKVIIGLISLVVLILVLVTVFQPSDFAYRDTTDYEAQRLEAQREQAEYAAYLASIQPDPAASRQFYQNLLDPKEVEAEVSRELSINQRVTIPTVSNADLTISPRGGEEGMVEYFNAMGQLVNQYQAQTEPILSNLFTAEPDVAGLSEGLNATTAMVNQLYQLPVPTEAVEFHKAELIALDQLKKTMVEAQNHATGKTAVPWPKVYNNYAVANDRVALADREFQKLDNQYKLSQRQLPFLANQPVGGAGLIKEAHAQFGVITVAGDIPRTIREALEDAWGASFTHFFTEFLDKLIEKIEGSYIISNFLYYTDALVNGQYVDDYLNKYVNNPLDQSLIKRFIPQITCSNNRQDLKPIFVAKAKQFFDARQIDPTQPNFYDLLFQAGNPLATPTGQEALFQDTASGALNKAHEAALTELLNDRTLKLPRTSAGRAINITVSQLGGRLQAALEARLNIGAANPNSIVSTLVTEGLKQFEDRFIFSGVVYKEQSTCIPYPQLQPVIPGSTPPFVPTGTAPRG